MDVGQKSKHKFKWRRDIYHFTVAAPMESFCKHGHHKDVDEEGHKKCHGRLNKEVLIGLFHLFLVGAIHLSGLNRGTHSYAGKLILTNECAAGGVGQGSLTLTKAECR